MKVVLFCLGISFLVYAWYLLGGLIFKSPPTPLIEDMKEFDKKVHDESY